MWTTASLVLASAVLAGAQSNGLAAYLSSVCTPTNSSGHPDLNVPCNAVYAIQEQCIFGIDSKDLWNLKNSSLSEGEEGQVADSRSQTGGYDEPPMQSNDTQRVCICESQFWDQLAGCVACYQAHAPDAALRENLPPSRLTSASSSYCAASATATIGLADYLLKLGGDGLESATTASVATETSTVNFRDPIGNKTEASYYYTAAVTGSAAWSISQPTGESSASLTYTTTNIQDGQIRPTASMNNPDATHSRGSNRGDSDSSASRFDVVGAASLFGLVFLVAWL
ncbi:hypothetical protein CERZMDRAFT_90544 [Cercospora zeae-maydis SCOH1-5]|uniref:Uncharacterized protein n=1 Tax=Cercospora zeae-maydis SCOH1-5 TaxID=717836 RepID=A0A6A6FHZ2_9PEZI|nr:hypothetical protein CERZMDRAFT_90544 [Cercospora zeae-maydis SCOH1-5]